MTPDVISCLSVLALALAQFSFGAGVVISCETRRMPDCTAAYQLGSALALGGAGTTAGLATRNPLLRRPEDN